MDGSSVTMTKAGTYVVYVRPFQFYGTDKEDFELNSNPSNLTGI